MSILDTIKSKFDHQKDPQTIAPIDAVSDPSFVSAPVSGAIIERQDVDSTVFADGLLGMGCAIQPQENVLYAPVTGTVTVTYAGSKHAVGIVGQGAVQVLMHVGLGTAMMEGKGFTYLVSQGSHVEAGQPLLTFDRKAIKAAGFNDIVLIAIPNAQDFTSVKLAAHGHIDAGQTLLVVE